MPAALVKNLGLFLRANIVQQDYDGEYSRQIRGDSRIGLEIHA